MAKGVRDGSLLTRSEKGKFPKGTQIVNKAGWLSEWAKPLAIKTSNKSPIFRRGLQHWQYDANGVPQKNLSPRNVGTKWVSMPRNTGGWDTIRVQDSKNPKKWNTQKKWKGTTISGANFITQLKLAEYYIEINLQHFRYAVGLRAQKVFQTSFKLHRFNSNGSKAWKPLAPYTILKRTRRGTGTTILKEYGKLLNSISFKSDSDKTTVFTKNIRTKKRKVMSYAGIHNEGAGNGVTTYGNWSSTPVVQRQFMGHSTLVEDYASEIANRYLFYDVFKDFVK